jgi:hypothetical protein
MDRPPCASQNVTVSWIASDSFAVKFPKLSAKERKRLQDLVWKNVNLSSLVDQRTAFRIV